MKEGGRGREGGRVRKLHFLIYYPSPPARLFQSWWDILVTLPNFIKTWSTLLAAIQLCASSTSLEVGRE